MSDLSIPTAGQTGASAMDRIAHQQIALMHGMTDLWTAMMSPARWAGVAMERADTPSEDRASGWNELDDRKDDARDVGDIADMGDIDDLDRPSNDVERPSDEARRPADDPSPEVREGEDGYVYTPDTPQEEVRPHDPDLGDSEAERDDTQHDSRDAPAA